MKFLFATLLFLIISNNSFSQLKPAQDTINEIHRIDLKLEKFRKQHQTGVLLSFLGAGIALVPTLATGEVNTGLLIGGSILSAIGLLTSLSSYSHLRYNPAENNPEPPKDQSSEPAPKAKPKNWWTPR
mgnify:FL=1